MLKPVLLIAGHSTMHIPQPCGRGRGSEQKNQQLLIHVKTESFLLLVFDFWRIDDFAAESQEKNLQGSSKGSFPVFDALPDVGYHAVLSATSFCNIQQIHFAVFIGIVPCTVV